MFNIRGRGGGRTHIGRGFVRAKAVGSIGGRPIFARPHLVYATTAVLIGVKIDPSVNDTRLLGYLAFRPSNAQWGSL